MPQAGDHIAGMSFTRPAWMRDALCRGTHDPERWFREKGGKPDRYAVSVCRNCPVQDDCLEFALTFPTPLWGVWGGWHAARRAKVRRRRGLVA